MSLCKFASAALCAVLLRRRAAVRCSTGRVGIEQLRSAATASPKDAAAQRELAIAELFSYEGDVARSDDALARALGARAERRAAVARARRRVRHARAARAGARRLPEAARARALVAGRDRAAPGRDRGARDLGARGRGARLRDARDAPRSTARSRSPKLSTPARYALGSELVQLAYRRGDLAARAARRRRSSAA